MVRPGRQEAAVDAAAVRVRLANTYWIGGGSGAGKSVIARRLAVQQGLRVYAADV
jgi:adenylylsulfate kinase-like enzyme